VNIPSVGNALYILARSYPGSGSLFRTLAGRRNVLWARIGPSTDECDNPTVESQPLVPADPTTEPNIPPRSDTEHPIDVQVHGRFMGYAGIGHRPGMLPGRIQLTPGSFWTNVYTTAEGLPPNLPRVTSSSPDLRLPAARVMEALGSSTNRSPFMLVDSQINAYKGRMFGLTNPFDPSDFARRASLAAQGNPEVPVTTLLTQLRNVSLI